MILSNDFSDKPLKKMSPAEALALIIKMNMTVRNYRLLRENALEKGHDIYPSYDAVDEMKKLCMPEGVEFSEDEAKVSMESLLNHRISRVLSLNPDMMDEMNRIAGQNYTARFTFYYKYGCGKVPDIFNCKQRADKCKQILENVPFFRW